MKRGLVTGGCGFIGSNLVHRLVKEGWVVDVVDDMSSGNISLLADLKMRVIPVGLLDIFHEDMKNQGRTRESDEVYVIEGDFSSRRILQNIANKKYDVVFHQAAIPRVSFSVENPSITTDVNISSTVRLFEACVDNVTRVVFASSSSVYGGAEELPTSEAHPKNPKSPYAWQKSAIEDFARMCWDLYKLDVVCLRYFNVFGPGQYGDSPYSTAVSAWCHAAKNGTECRSDGDGTQSRDMCYVDNVVQANMLAAESKINFMGRFYNIACSDRTSNNEILDYFKNRFNVTVAGSPWRPGDVMHTQADISRAREELGYEPAVRFWEGLERTVDWWNINDGD